ncbi:carbohydrate ABC transporter permease [Cohnella rhizosphaerae]|uniref:Carbohydrate ABC transporter permease n=1 Tax=Cohnella rhizosphaerae TaxID=1457232 RepID=A0A9X4QSD1_9BACL|nr:carbohydrate ABC transporter permease [Cohnella rhizosphaerae]MDG0808407.1 carbohydrate ABC transporter permease [Cohnella rhizosphaerae]
MQISRLAKLWKLFAELIMLGVVAVYLLPVWIVVVNSLKDTIHANRLGYNWPKQLHLDNYAKVFEKSNALSGIYNGLFIGITVVLIGGLFSAAAAYYIARKGTRFARFASLYFLSGIIIPTAIIPTYFAMLILDLNNTYLGLIAIFTTYTLPLSVFLYIGFLKTIPREIDEAAIIDGSKPYQMFVSIILPLLAPVSVTVVVLNFIGVWNDVSTYLYFSGGDKWPLPMTVFIFFGKYKQQWDLLFADILIATLPSLLFFVFGQRYMVSGLTAGSVKA